MKIEQMTITPEIAKIWLDLNINNRRVRKNHVAFLSRQMKEGQWKVNGETIKLNGNRLIDGQHRLLACVDANTPFESLVVKDVGSHVFDTIDTGEIRKNSDVFAIIGESNVTLLTSILRIYAGYIDYINTGKEFSTTYRKKRSNVEYEDLLTSYPEVRESAKFTASRRCNFLTPSIIGGCYHIFSMIDEDEARDFMVKLIDGTELQNGSPILHIRNKFITSRTKQEPIIFEAKLAIIIKAWNHIRIGRNAKRIHWNKSESFPIAK